MKASVYHVQLNVRDAGVSVPFYRELLGYLEYRVMVGRDDVLGMGNGTTDVWIVAAGGDRVGARLHRKNPGLNHVAFRVGQRTDGDRFHDELLRARGIAGP
jgi:catechol 2,3-dioxygenase-like lactoylglutathione lyase family enzyme